MTKQFICYQKTSDSDDQRNYSYEIKFVRIFEGIPIDIEDIYLNEFFLLAIVHRDPIHHMRI